MSIEALTKPSIYGPEYDTLNALSLKLNEWDTEVRKMGYAIEGRHQDADEAFRIVLDHLSDAMADVMFTIDKIKADDAEDEPVEPDENEEHRKDYYANLGIGRTAA